jgi:hypothetical protein
MKAVSQLLLKAFSVLHWHPHGIIATVTKRSNNEPAFKDGKYVITFYRETDKLFKEIHEYGTRNGPPAKGCRGDERRVAEGERMELPRQGAERRGEREMGKVGYLAIGEPCRVVP